MLNNANLSSDSSSSTPSLSTIRYECLTCRKVFPTAQALEGHQSAHQAWWSALFAQHPPEQTLDVSTNPKLAEALGSGGGSSSGAKNPSTDDDPARDPDPKNGDKDADLKLVMPMPNLSLGCGATECGSLEEVSDSEADLDWEDDEEFMPFYDGDCEASDSERVVPDCDDLDL